jgi:hypothetical protein
VCEEPAGFPGACGRPRVGSPRTCTCTFHRAILSCASHLPSPRRKTAPVPFLRFAIASSWLLPRVLLTRCQSECQSIYCDDLDFRANPNTDADVAQG